MGQLAIKRSSGHYRYYSTLTKFWGFDKISEPRGLCAYSQFIFWMSIASVIIFPLVAFSWCLLKILRGTYKTLMKFTPTRKVIDSIDRKIDMGDKINFFSEGMQESSPVCSIVISVLCFCIVALISVAIVGVPVLIKALIYALPFICLAPGILIFVLFSIVGGLLSTCAVWLWIALKWLFGIIVAYGAITIFIIACIIAAGSIAFGICYLIYLFCKTSLGKKIIEYFSFKINGFQEAREKAVERRRIEQEEQAKQPPREPSDSQKRMNKIVNKINGVFHKIGDFFVGFGKKTIQAKDTTFEVIGGIGLLWEMIKSLKSGVCPMVTFIDEEDVAADEQEEENTEG
jgi:hypothetical protein